MSILPFHKSKNKKKSSSKSKSNGLKKKGLLTSTPKKDPSDSASSLGGPLSVKSTPGQLQKQRYKPLTSPMGISRSSLDVGNATEPLPSSRQTSPSRRPNGWHQKTYITPDINSVRPRQSKGIFSSKRNGQDDDHEDDDVAGGDDQSAFTGELNGQGMPSVDIPIAKNGTLDSENSLHSSHNTASRKPSNTQLVDSATDQDVAEKSTKHDSTHSGIFSTFMSAAHTAATHIGSITGSKTHPAENVTQDGNTTGNNNNNNDDDFLHHLDSLMSLNGSKKQISSTPSQNGNHTQEGGDGGEVLDEISQNSKTVAHDVKFEPLRKTIVSTMGKGELTLEELGFTENPAGSSVMGQLTPQIEVQSASDHSKALNSPTLSPVSDVTRQRSNSNGNSSRPLLKSSMSSSTQALQKVKSPEIGRSISPPPFKRSLSPNYLKKSETKALTMPRRSQSTHDRNSLMNGDISFDAPLTQMSTIDLKNVSFANDKRNGEFHSIFKKIPKTEKLIDDYSCALQRELMVQGRVLINEKILVQGRMYISERFISFKSNILGWVTALNIPIHEIVQLEKKNTAGVFPNAIVIQTLHQRYIFASFLTRDTTFDLITNIWNQIVRGSMEDKDDIISQDDNRRGRSRTMSFGSHRIDSESDEYDEEDEDLDSDDTFSGVDDDGGDHTKSTPSKAADPDVPNITKHAPTEPEHTETQGEVKITEQIIPAPLPRVYSLLYGKDTGFMTSLIAKQKNYNISPITPFQSKDGVPTREYRFTKPLGGPVGPKETVCEVNEVIDKKDFKNYIRCTQTTKTPGVPSGSAFSVVTWIYLSWGPKNSTKLTVYTFMNWTGKSWIRSAIDRGSIDGQKDSIGILVNELRAKAATDAPAPASSSADSEGAAVSNLPLIGPKTHPSANFTPTVPSPEAIITEETLQAPLGTVYALCMNPDYLKQILQAQKMYDLSTIPPFPEEGTKKRSYTYIKPLGGPVGPKSTKCNVTDTVEHYDLNSYIQVTRVTTTPDVPSGNSFHVSTNFWLSWADNNATKVVVSTGVVWKGKSWLKGVIEKGSIDGQKEGNKIMVQELKDIIAKDSAGGKSASMRKRTKSTIKDKSETDDGDAFLRRINEPRKGYNFTLPWLSTEGGPLNSILGLFIMSVIIWTSFKIFSGAPDNTSSLSLGNGVNKVMIGGREYLIVPTEDPKEKIVQEYEIWKWIDSRTDNTKPGFDDEEKCPGNIGAVMKAHKEQDLREMLHIAESHLAELLQRLDSRGEHGSSSAAAVDML